MSNLINQIFGALLAPWIQTLRFQVPSSIKDEALVMKFMLGGLAGRTSTTKKIAGTPAPFRVGMNTMPVNFTNLFNSTKGVNGSSLNITHSTGTISIAASNKMRVQQLIDLGSDLASVDTDQYLSKVCKKNLTVMQYRSQYGFSVVPFIVVLENGETITATNYNGSSVGTAIGTSIGSQTAAVYYGPTVSAKMTPEPSDVTKMVFSATLGIDYTDLWNAYAIHYRKKLFAEEAPLALLIGAVYVGIAGQTIYYEKIDGNIPYLFDLSQNMSFLTKGS